MARRAASLLCVEPRAHLDTLAHGIDALLTAARGSFERPVPTCPDWSVADLVVHIGGVWGWAARIVASGKRAERPDPPHDRTDAPLLAWARGEAELLLDTLGAADPDADCWTFGPPSTARFWFRRQALETVLHTWDAVHAIGEPEAIDPAIAPAIDPAIDPAIAADGVDEHLSVILPRALRRNPGRWSGQTVHLHRTDGEGEWVVRLGPGGKVVTERAHLKADLALRGSAEALWLWATNRMPLDALGIEQFGDAGVAAIWSAQTPF